MLLNCGSSRGVGRLLVTVIGKRASRPVVSTRAGTLIETSSPQHLVQVLLDGPGVARRRPGVTLRHWLLAARGRVVRACCARRDRRRPGGRCRSRSSSLSSRTSVELGRCELRVRGLAAVPELLVPVGRRAGEQARRGSTGLIHGTRVGPRTVLAAWAAVVIRRTCGRRRARPPVRRGQPGVGEGALPDLHRRSGVGRARVRRPARSARSSRSEPSPVPASSGLGPRAEFSDSRIAFGRVSRQRSRSPASARPAPGSTSSGSDAGGSRTSSPAGAGLVDDRLLGRRAPARSGRGCRTAPGSRRRCSSSRREVLPATGSPPPDRCPRSSRRCRRGPGTRGAWSRVPRSVAGSTAKLVAGWRAASSRTPQPARRAPTSSAR